jgi:hypothetical protein
MGDALVLTEHWCKVIEEPNVDCGKPGIYLRQVEDAGTYIGRYTKNAQTDERISPQCRAHPKGLQSHHPDGRFRRIHYALADAVRDGKCITLSIVANCTPSELKRVEQDSIRRERPT